LHTTSKKNFAFNRDSAIRARPLLWLGFALLFAGSLHPQATLHAQPTPVDKKFDQKFEELIKQLCGPDAKAADLAEARLLAMPEAIPALRETLESRDLTVHLKAKEVLREALLRKNRYMVEGYPIDLFLERLLRVDDAYEEESYWRVTAELVGKILDHENREFKLNRWRGEFMSKMPAYDFLKYRDTLEDNSGRRPSIIIPPSQPLPEKRGIYVIRRESIDCTREYWCGWSLLTSPGRIRVGENGMSVILGGSTASIQSANGIVVADGDIRAHEVKGGLVITRGSLFCDRGIERAVVLAGAEVISGRSKVPASNIVRSGVPKLLGWVRFFEISDAGLEVTATDDGVKVTKVADKQPPQRAGLQSGDIITAIEGKEFKDVEQFRRLLRHSTVQEACKFTVRRGNKTLELSASFVGWEPPPAKP